MVRSTGWDRERRILNAAQGDLSPGKFPFRAWGEEAGVPEGLLLKALRALQKRGIIRRFGGVFDSRKMGWKTTLVGARVSEQTLDAALDRIRALDGATHVYLRNHKINVWFTLAAKSEEEIDEVLGRLKREGLVEAAWSMPARRRFKLKFRF
ncbi:MAG: Lrp/AsnC family transcriptional regulator [Planctomycetota bacterium]|jgi:DNA-binding Lrp family transcriptional regulator